jgi:DNA-binding NtrC family response regulator
MQRTVWVQEEVMASPIKTVPRRFDLAHDRPKFRTLLVDEDPSDVRYYYGVLRALGHEVVIAESYAEALAQLERENFDMAVVAQGSPAFDGREVLARALEINPELPVLVVARTLDIDCYLEAMEMGAADYLERCAAPREFMRAVDVHLQMKAAA